MRAKVLHVGMICGSSPFPTQLKGPLVVTDSFSNCGVMRSTTRIRCNVILQISSPQLSNVMVP